MSSIQLSPAWTTSMVTRLFRLNDGFSGVSAYATSATTGLNIQYSTSGLLNASASNQSASSVLSLGGFFIMSGTKPDSPSALTTLAPLASNILVRFVPGGNDPGDFVTSQVNVNPAIISTQYAPAIASGTATWFLWFTCQGTNQLYPSGKAGVHDTTKPFGHVIIGTVGATGSGADLEMPSATIVSGEQYRISNLRIQFPDSWTY